MNIDLSHFRLSAFLLQDWVPILLVFEMEASKKHILCKRLIYLKYIRSICRREGHAVFVAVRACNCLWCRRWYLAPCFASSVTQRQPFLWGVFGMCLDLPTGMYLHRASPPVFTHYDQLTVFALEIAILSLMHTLA